MDYKMFFCLFLIALVDVEVANTASEVEGYSVGYLSVCPGVTNSVKLTNRSLRRISFIHLSPGDRFAANKTQHNYFNMKNLAKELDYRRKTLIYMAGYMDSSNMFMLTPSFGTLYTKRGYNVLLIEYYQLSAYMYHRAARLVRAVANKAAEMIVELTQYGLDPKRVQLMGINLGAQGIGFIGKRFREITGRNISRITALEPSGPCFRRLGPEDRIDASDADMVDVVHTSIDGYGIAAPVGQVNFYVNGGEFQPFDLFPDGPCVAVCSHFRALYLWVAAVYHPEKFVAMQCDSIQDARHKNCYNRPLVTNLFGPRTDFSKPGIFYLQTRNGFPFYLGAKGVLKEVDVYYDYLKSLNKVDVMVV